MGNENRDFMDQLLRFVGEEANAEIPFDRLHDGILLAKKREEKKRRNLIRTLSAAASFVVLLGVGTLFVSHVFGAKTANDSAAPMEAYDTAAAVQAEAPAEMAAETESFSYSSDSYGRNTAGGAYVVCEEEPAPEAPSAMEAPEAGPAKDGAFEEPMIPDANTVSSSAPMETSSENAEVILIGQILSAEGGTYTVQVTEFFSGRMADELTFFAPENIFEEGDQCLLILENENGTLSLTDPANAFFLKEDLAFPVSGEEVARPYKEILTEIDAIR